MRQIGLNTTTFISCTVQSTEVPIVLICFKHFLVCLFDIGNNEAQLVNFSKKLELNQ